jgi:glycine oxidase
VEPDPGNAGERKLQTPTRRSYDAVVVGAGLIGLACAWRAAQRGLSVAVIDRERAGAGASGVAAGMLAPVTEADFGEQELLRANLASREMWPAFAAELEERSGMGCGYRDSGALVAAADRDDAEELRRLHDFQRSLGLKAEWLGRRDCRRLEPGLAPRVAGGIFAPQDGHVDPRATMEALRSELARCGGELLEGAEVAGLEREGDRVTGVRTEAATITAAAVVMAAGAWSGELAAEAPPIRPVKGQIVELRVRGAAHPPDRILRTPRCYLFARAGGRVALGATTEERGFDTTVTVEGVYRLMEAAWEVFPEVAELELIGARAGLRPATPDNRPLVGRGDEEGLVWATGHYRHGVLLAPLTATAVADILSGAAPPEETESFSPRRFELAGRAAG